MKPGKRVVACHSCVVRVVVELLLDNSPYSLDWESLDTKISASVVSRPIRIGMSACNPV